MSQSAVWTPPPNRVGKVAAVVALVVIVAGIIGLTTAIVAIQNDGPVKITSVSESVDDADGCGWVLEVELLNNTDEPLMIERIDAILNQGRRSGIMESAPLVSPAETAKHDVRFRLPAADVCPAVDEINHGNLIFVLPDGSTESIRF